MVKKAPEHVNLGAIASTSAVGVTKMSQIVSTNTQRVFGIRPGTTINLTLSSSVVARTSTLAGARAVEIVGNANFHYEVAASTLASATTNKSFVPKNTVVNFGVRTNDEISVVAASVGGSGKVFITPFEVV